MTNNENKMSIAKCLSQVESALANYDLYESCYEGLLNIPFVSKLKNHNDLLCKQVESLNESIHKLQEIIRTQNNNVSYTISESAADEVEYKTNDNEKSSYENENNYDGTDSDDDVSEYETDSDDDVSEYETDDGEEEVEVEGDETEEVEVEGEEEETEEVEVEGEEEETEEVEVEGEETEEVEVEVEGEETEEVEVEGEETEEVEVEEETEEVEVEEETEEVEVEEETEEVEVEGEETEEEGVELIMIDGVNYFTSNNVNGEIYKYVDDENVGDLIGRFQESVPLWY